MSRLVGQTGPVTLGQTGVAAFETVRVHAAYHARYLRIEGRRAYEVGNGCETCTFWFTRLEGANSNVSVDGIRSRLAEGLQSVMDPAVEEFSRVLSSGKYIVALLDILPRLVGPTDADGYFAREQVDLWGTDGFWGLPHYPHSEYYRFDDREVTPTAKLFEFVIPMYPSTWLKSDTVDSYTAQLGRSELPTAVSLSVLDIKQPAVWTEGTQINTHWCLAHYLLDGHHKLYAAASEGRPVRMVSFVSIDQGVSTEEDVATALGILHG